MHRAVLSPEGPSAPPRAALTVTTQPAHPSQGNLSTGFVGPFPPCRGRDQGQGMLRHQSSGCAPVPKPGGTRALQAGVPLGQG